ncbi:DUF6455 family protein [Ruegeria meonggei]|uniref:DUF6455 domain-containing protein n=1 Tax=Ruegeria meonggei TaxID=1446476 RepID=A0A1X6YI67_9RHOB|nr:DUF6455 family protein [Ruegeria meonggei]SLN22055.1 hypothetical protein RUM8411_00829 [Ruegeria meonggei]
MPRLGQIMTHFRLVQQMGKTTGTDVVAAHRKGYLSQQDWADMIEFCRGCSWAKECPNWLSRHHAASNAPEACINQQRFAALKALQEQEMR